MTKTKISPRLVHPDGEKRGFTMDDVAVGSPATVFKSSEQMHYCRFCKVRFHGPEQIPEHRHGECPQSNGGVLLPSSLLPRMRMHIEHSHGDPITSLLPRHVQPPRKMVPMGPATVTALQRSKSGVVYNVTVRAEWTRNAYILRFALWKKDGLYRIQGVRDISSPSYFWVVQVGARDQRDELLSEETGRLLTSLKETHANGGRSYVEDFFGHDEIARVGTIDPEALTYPRL